MQPRATPITFCCQQCAGQQNRNNNHKWNELSTSHHTQCRIGSIIWKNQQHTHIHAYTKQDGSNDTSGQNEDKKGHPGQVPKWLRRKLKIIKIRFEALFCPVPFHYSLHSLFIPLPLTLHLAVTWWKKKNTSAPESLARLDKQMPVCSIAFISGNWIPIALKGRVVGSVRREQGEGKLGCPLTDRRFLKKAVQHQVYKCQRRWCWWQKTIFWKLAPTPESVSRKSQRVVTEQEEPRSGKNKTKKLANFPLGWNIMQRRGKGAWKIGWFYELF